MDHEPRQVVSSRPAGPQRLYFRRCQRLRGPEPHRSPVFLAAMTSTCATGVAEIVHGVFSDPAGSRSACPLALWPHSANAARHPIDDENDQRAWLLLDVFLLDMVLPDIVFYRAYFLTGMAPHLLFSVQTYSPISSPTNNVDATLNFQGLLYVPGSSTVVSISICPISGRRMRSII